MTIHGFHKALESIGITKEDFRTSLKSHIFKYMFVDFSILCIAQLMVRAEHRLVGSLLDPINRNLQARSIASAVCRELDNLKVPNTYVIVDGQAPIEKAMEYKRRNKKSRTSRINLIDKFYNDGDIIKFAKRIRQATMSIVNPRGFRTEIAMELNTMGYPIIVSIGEAEALCSALANKFRNFGAIAYTMDTDVYAMGCPYTLWRGQARGQGKVKEGRLIYSFELLLAKFKKYISAYGIHANLCTAEHFKRVCILLGCDFTDCFLNIGIAIKLIFGIMSFKEAERYQFNMKEMERVLGLFSFSQTGLDDFTYTTCKKTGHCIISHDTLIKQPSKSTSTAIKPKVSVNLSTISSAFNTR